VLCDKNAHRALEHSTLGIDDRRLVSLYAVRVLAPGRVGIRVVEGVDRIGPRNRNVKARAGCQVADGKVHSVDLGLPKKLNLDRPAQPLGEFFASARSRIRPLRALGRHWRQTVNGLCSWDPFP
jgi:hypothetical protein